MFGTYLKFIFLIIIFSNQIFAKDFDDLFSVKIKIEGESIDKSIDKSFESLVFRLLGSKDYEKMKIIKGKYDSKDFLKTYTLITKEDIKLLHASFDEVTLIKQFVDNDISFIGRNRPIVFLDIEIDNGFGKPFKVESIPYENSLQSSIQEVFNGISQERGIFFEFPQDSINFVQSDYFFEEQISNDFKQYKFDYFATINIIRLDINSWSISYDDKVLFFDGLEKIIEYIESVFYEKASLYLSDFILDSLEEEIVMRVSEINSTEKLDNLLDVLDKMISIKSYGIASYEDNEISLILKIFGTQDQFIQTVKTHKDLVLEKSREGLIETSLIKI